MEITLKRFFLILCVFLLPWQARYFVLHAHLGGVYWEYGSIYIYVWQILIWITIVLHYKEIKNFFNSRYAFFSCAVLILSLVSIFHSRFPLLVLFYWFHILEALILYALFASQDIQEKKLLRQFFIMSAVVQACVAVGQFFTQYSPPITLLGMSEHDPRQLGVSVIEYGLERWLRAYGTLPHPNILGGFIAIGMLFTARHYSQRWEEFVHDVKGKLRAPNPAYTMGAWVLLSMGLVVSFSKSAWIALVASLCMLWMTTKQKWAITKLGILLVVVFGLAVIVQPELVGVRVLGHGRLEEQSYTERKVSIIAGLYVIKDSPWWGYGLGNYTYALSQKFDYWIPYYYQPIHNAFLMVWAETGIVSMLFALLLIGIWLIKKNPFILLLFIISLFDHYLVSMPFGFYLIAVSAGLWADNDTRRRWAVREEE